MVYTRKEVIALDALLYTVKEVAQILKVNPHTVRRWIREGKIQSVKIENNVRITNASFQKFLEGNEGE